MPPTRGSPSEPAPRPGRDRNAELHPAPPGRPSVGHLDRPPRVVVVGGGIAGVTAAVALAERGVAVRLVEKEPDLGGRLRGWRSGTDAPARTMTRGFHAFFRQYYNLRALLRRVSPDLAMLRPVPDYPLLHVDGTAESFAGIPRTPPWNVAGFVLRSKTFTFGDLRRMNPVRATRLFDVSVPRTYTELDSVDATTFLRDIGFPPAARHLAFEVFSRSFFADPANLSAAELATMFHIYFLGSNEGLIFDVPRDSYPTTLWHPLRRLLTDLGAEVRTGTAVSHIERDPSGFTVHTGTERLEVDSVVLAADASGLRHLVAASPTLGDTDWRSRIAELRTAPPFLVSRLWLDRAARRDRAPFLGTSGFPLLDNISVLELFEDEARTWRAGTGGSVIELHAYALPEDLDQERARHDLVARMRTIYPELADARIRHEEHVLAADCPLFAPGSFPRRPTVTTPDPGLVLAGDLLRIDLPVALMERAATTGFAAANALLSQWRVHGHDLWTVTNGGRSPFLRRTARRAAS
jgi:carotenoid phi-ring synthase / carotenoid chi-ring synthase